MPPHFWGAFNIRGNNYRLIVHVVYRFHAVSVRFIGTHAKYDEVKATRVRKAAQESATHYWILNTSHAPGLLPALSVWIVSPSPATPIPPPFVAVR